MRMGIGLARIVAIALAFFGTSSSYATTITIEPDDYAPGTDVSNVVEGVTLQVYGFNGTGSPYLAPVYVMSNPHCETTSDCDAVTGTSGFSPNSSGFGSLTSWATGGGITQPWDCFVQMACAAGSGFTALLIAFDRPTEFFEISGAWNQDWIMAIAFDSSRNFLSASSMGSVFSGCYVAGGDLEYCHNTIDLTSDTASISYVLVSSWYGIASLDRLQFRSVPEPGTLALLGLGLVGLGISRRKSR